MKKAAIVACSNAKEFQYRPQIDDLTDYLHSVGIEAVLSDCIFSDDSVFPGTPRERAAQLMRMYRDPEVEEIYDISGVECGIKFRIQLFEEVKRSQIGKGRYIRRQFIPSLFTRRDLKSDRPTVKLVN